ncbi:hypothetical protein BKA61DRAFT_601447 [Leptodontidium sp. MPI-SDFR-AT-0119]|nr:hypothetical protein BKA61DRAFT_601447 [Leptodontidium sp. MPI-SDFR-AT-0119]
MIRALKQPPVSFLPLLSRTTLNYLHSGSQLLIENGIHTFSISVFYDSTHHPSSPSHPTPRETLPFPYPPSFGNGMPPIFFSDPCLMSRFRGLMALHGRVEWVVVRIGMFGIRRGFMGWDGMGWIGWGEIGFALLIHPALIMRSQRLTFVMGRFTCELDWIEHHLDQIMAWNESLGKRKRKRKEKERRGGSDPIEQSYDRRQLDLISYIASFVSWDRK